MDYDFASFGKRTDAGWRAAPDFRALVAFLAAAQASQPTAQRAIRLDSCGEETRNVVAALIGLFAPNGHSVPAGAVLQGRFNPGVSISNGPITPYQPV